MIKLNNKGFAVSAVLYTLLIAFLLFLGVTLAQFSASTNILNNANKDIINGTEFSVKQVKANDIDCESGDKWYESQYIVQIKSRYGTMYWPKDFSEDGFDDCPGDYCNYKNNCTLENTSDCTFTLAKEYKNIVVMHAASTGSDDDFVVKDKITNATIKIDLYKICGD